MFYFAWFLNPLLPFLPEVNIGSLDTSNANEELGEYGQYILSQYRADHLPLCMRIRIRLKYIDAEPTIQHH